jgi:AcrR family transcriptional regulator
MAPRTYTLGRRADSADATRQRILDATLELYRELGVPATTLKAVAQRADVSRGTILHHYGSAEGLLGAVLDRVLESLDLPDPQSIERLTDPDARVREFVNELIDFQNRTTHWWTLFESQMQRPEAQQREAVYWAWFANMQAAALGPGLRDDPAANAALMSVVHPATLGTFFWAFEQVGLPREDARPLLEQFAVDAVRRIADRRTGKGGSQ